MAENQLTKTITATNQS